MDNINTNVNRNIDKKFLIGAAVLIAVLIIAVFGYWYYKKVYKATVTSPNAIEQAGNAAENLGKQASQGVLPSINPSASPMQNAPGTNPVSKTNPFFNIKTNPFSAQGGSASGGK